MKKNRSNKKIPLLIKKSFYAPKVVIDKKNIHAISIAYCNFNCTYCDFHYRKKDTKYTLFSKPLFFLRVLLLRPYGRCYKFTGGEPCMNPYIKEFMRVIRLIGGKIYLDSNCSMPHIIKELLDDGLIDVLAISLKGLTEDEAIRTTGVSKQLCWDNVIRTLSMTEDYDGLRVICTYVCDSHFSLSKMERFSKIIEHRNNVILKINNYQKSKYVTSDEWTAISNDTINDIISTFINNNPEWKNRIVYIPNHNAVEHYDSIEFR